ncbi:glutamine synthetase family protein [Limobrevibacterium gyesilva]|uniref:Glutamine synthetase family protein n=1 Tax=Limobrevibacterium gyesilva TaxID=2991712 RepID=A0AA41YQV7_9PROT|nr:glutamine synthetase family protein [Limobrevibacterium gyesilva]MCW3477056.1 glutamine synthetase family protein [Limobrevibacterium gyesilva]
MHREPLIMVCTCEIAGRVRGKGFPARDLPARLAKGVGWVPTNTMISAFGPIYATPFGTTGDLILVPDSDTEVNVDFGDGGAAEHFFLGDIRQTDGTPWECCPRHFLRRALAALHEISGLTLLAAFEHEFVYTGVEAAPGAPYSLDAYRRQGIFGEAFTAALRAAGVAPDSFLPEYGTGQFEVTCDPTAGLRAADDAVITREIARATALRLGHRAIFAPILDPAGVGNGVHVHFSFRDADGRPVMHDPAGRLGLSPVAQHFVAGLLHHMPALCAVTAPSSVSYIRMRPNRWAPTHATLADRDRGASLRVCPVLTTPGADAARQFNVEYRPADAAASPYLALGALVWAGVDGIRRALALPDSDGDKLPVTLGAALDALEATPQAADWFGATYLSAYLMHKRAELASLDGLSETEQCARYALTY